MICIFDATVRAVKSADCPGNAGLKEVWQAQKQLASKPDCNPSAE
jgi:hypothetical protein